MTHSKETLEEKAAEYASRKTRRIYGSRVTLESTLVYQRFYEDYIEKHDRTQKDSKPDRSDT